MFLMAYLIKILLVSDIHTILLKNLLEKDSMNIL